MYELIKINENDYYIECPSRVGIVKISDSEAIVIDSGNDKNVGKKILAHLNTLGLRLKAVYNTHFHADHIGANAYLYEATGCKIFARGIETAFIGNTVLEPITLFGAKPTDELCGKFFVAKPSCAEPICERELPGGLEMISLSGHTQDMVGFRTAGGTVYLADALSSIETLDKYKIGVIYDVGEYLKTLNSLKEIKGKIFVPAHVTPVADIRDLADYNLKCVEGIIERILNFLAAPHCFEDVLAHLVSELGINFSIEQYALVGSTVRSYLSYLKAEGRVECETSGGYLLWKRV